MPNYFKENNKLQIIKWTVQCTGEKLRVRGVKC